MRRYNTAVYLANADDPGYLRWPVRVSVASRYAEQTTRVWLLVLVYSFLIEMKRADGEDALFCLRRGQTGRSPARIRRVRHHGYLLQRICRRL